MTPGEINILRVLRYREGTVRAVEDEVVVERPLDIYVNGRRRFACMRLPGRDVELAAGLCLSHGLARRGQDIAGIVAEGEGRITVSIPGLAEGDDRTVIQITSSSGEMDFSRGREAGLVIPAAHHITAGMIFAMNDDFRRRQDVFRRTGGAHASAVYDGEGGLLAFAEDVGRHNAFDKCAGRLLLDNSTGKAVAGVLSSRISFEMVMKALSLNLEIVTGMSAPTTAAVDLAEKCGLTLAGFVRDGCFNLYSRPERVALS